MADTPIKICVVGPQKSGKTLFCRLVADQPIPPNEYAATVAVRIQEFSRDSGIDHLRVQLWDCSGNSQYQPYWQTLAKDLDGVLLVIDPSRPETEKELETFYTNFAQPNNLTTKQCMVLAVKADKEGTGAPGGWQGAVAQKKDTIEKQLMGEQ